MVYAMQRELVSGKSSIVDFLGSDEATTCNIVFIWSSLNKKGSVGHFDGSSGQIGEKNCSIKKLIETFTKEEQEYGLDVHIIGGFEDEDKLSMKIIKSILVAFHIISNIQFTLLTGCFFVLNNEFCGQYNRPIITGGALQLKTGILFPVSNFHFRGPDEILRSSRFTQRNPSLENIYDPEKDQYFIKPFPYKSFSRTDLLIQFSDDQLIDGYHLQNL